MSNSYFTPDISEFTLPYGKHAGRLLSEVPRPYLHWAYNECDFKYFPEYQRAIEAYLGLTPDPNIRVGNRDSKVGPAGNGAARGAPETGLGGFRRAFERARREAILEFEDEPEIRDLLEETLDKVRKALGI